MSRSFAVAVSLLFLAACDGAPEDAAKTYASPPNRQQAEAAIDAAVKAATASGTPILAREQALDLAARSNCLLCHKIDYKLVGPAWKDVAAKYRSLPNAPYIVASHISSGGRFGWNFGTMPARGGSMISDANIASLARFIASLE